MTSEVRILRALVDLVDRQADLMADLLGADWPSLPIRLRALAVADGIDDPAWQDELDDILEWLTSGPAGRIVRPTVASVLLGDGHGWPGAAGERQRSSAASADRAAPATAGSEAGADTTGVTVPAANSRSRVVNLALTRDGRTLERQTPLRHGQRAALRYDIGSYANESLLPATAAPLPEASLPPTDVGHWLEIVVDSADVDLERQRASLFLPLAGSAWHCDCPSERHVCAPTDRLPHVEFPFTMRSGRPKVVLRAGTYSGANLLQLHVVVADVATPGPAARAEPGGDRPRQRAEVAYSLHPRLTTPDALPERDVSIAECVPAGPRETHRLIVHDRSGETLSFGLAEGQVRTAVLTARQALRDAHFVEKDDRRLSLLDQRNSKSREPFLEDLQTVADVGWLLWTAIFADQIDAFRRIEATLASPQRLQICRTGAAELAFPWSMIYDIPLVGGAAERRLCPILDTWDWDGPIPATVDGGCPYADRHRANVLCPYGFWGFRHTIEHPPSVPAGGRLSLEIPLLSDPARAVAGFSPLLDPTLTERHVDRLTRALGKRLTVAPCYTTSALRDALATSELPIAYLYCHGIRSPLSVTGSTAIPHLVLDDGGTLRPQDLVGLRMGAWSDDHWRVVRPLVFINGCHTAELTPEDLLSFVTAFVDVGAAGLVGTEITMHQSLAAEAAELFFAEFAAGADVGSAIRTLRWRLLAKGNLLGLAYTPYCSSSLSLRSLVSPDL